MQTATINAASRAQFANDFSVSQQSAQFEAQSARFEDFLRSDHVMN